MAKSKGIDTGVLIYLGLINTLIESLKHPENRDIVLKRARELSEPLEGKYKIRIRETSKGLLEVDGDVPAQAREQFCKLFLGMVGALEDKYGVAKTWINLRAKIHPVIIEHQDETTELNMEVPLSKFELEFMLQSTLSKSWVFKTFFGVVGQGRWSKGAILVTSKRLIIESGSSKSEIAMSDILTVGREVYSDVSLKYSSRSVRMIDYKSTLGIAAFMYEGPPDVLSEFNRIVSRARIETKGLTSIEKKILVVLDRKQPLTTLLSHGDVDKKSLALALARLRQIDYITKDYELTSYGINSLSRVIHERYT
ncbi:MAG: hypothetical protein ABH834_02595 [Candidatus Altiarchaeota archaeon]